MRFCWAQVLFNKVICIFTKNLWGKKLIASNKCYALERIRRVLQQKGDRPLRGTELLV